MPTEQEHRDQAERNELFYATICGNNSQSVPFTEWEVVALFYSALHYVDAFLAKDNVHPKSHTTRKTLVAQTPQLKSIYGAYSNLYDRSQDARYELLQFPQDKVVKLYTQDFQHVKVQLRMLLGLPP